MLLSLSLLSFFLPLQIHFLVSTRFLQLFQNFLTKLKLKLIHLLSLCRISSKKMKARLCELCNGDATLYCVSDLAFLCLNCDARVHQANFLVARHVRRTICCKCKDFDGNSISGVGSRRNIEPMICPSCLSDSDDHTNNNNNNNSSCISSSSSTCISGANNQSSNQLNSSKIVFSTGDTINFSTEVSKKKTTTTKNRKIPALNMDFKEEDILVNWYRKLGVKCNKSSITLALQAFGICLQKTSTNLPFRVSLASSLWLSLKLTLEKPAVATCQNLKKLEQISGVPAKLILLAEKKISNVLKKDQVGKSSSKFDDDIDMQEGWAECSDD